MRPKVCLPVAMALTDVHDEYAKLVRGMNPPRVVIDNDASDDVTVIRVDRVNSHGTLLAVAQGIVDLNLVIRKAYFSSDGRWFMDVFNVTDRDGNKVLDEPTISYIQTTLEAEFSAVHLQGLPFGLSMDEMEGPILRFMDFSPPLERTKCLSLIMEDDYSWFETYPGSLVEDGDIRVALSAYGFEMPPVLDLDKRVGSRAVHVPEHYSVHHPGVQMGLLATVLRDGFNRTLLVGEGTLLNSSSYGEERHGSKMYALVMPQSLTPGDGGSSSTGAPTPVLWVDSGAVHHVVGDAKILSNLRAQPAGMAVTVADGSRLAVAKVGDIQTPGIKVQDVYYVPGLQMNLVSVRQLAKSKIVTTFYENYAELCLEGILIGGAIIVEYESLYKLYYLQAP